MKLVAVNGRKFSKEVLGDALRAGKNSSAPLELLVENTEYYKTYKLDYHDGEKFPHLVRDETKPDLLSDIIKPTVAVVSLRSSVVRRRSHLALCGF